jgi:hypothetical protein
MHRKMMLQLAWLTLAAIIQSVYTLRLSTSASTKLALSSERLRSRVLQAAGVNEYASDRRRRPPIDMMKLKVNTIRLLCKMITSTAQGKPEVFQFKDMQIEEKIKQFKINLSIPDPDTGLLPLRCAIRSGRRDVCRVLLRHGASPLARDHCGIILHEALLADQPGSLHMLTGL